MTNWTMPDQKCKAFESTCDFIVELMTKHSYQMEKCGQKMASDIAATGSAVDIRVVMGHRTNSIPRWIAARVSIDANDFPVHRRSCVRFAGDFCQIARNAWANGIWCDFCECRPGTLRRLC